MKLFRILFPAWMILALGCVLTMNAVAQDGSQGGTAEAAVPAATAPVPAPAPDKATAGAGEAREWVPLGIAVLGQGATSRTEFTLDHSMLVLVSKLDKDNEDLRRVIAGVNGVSVHSFRFPAGVRLDSTVMDGIGQEYSEAGWLHLVTKYKGVNGVQTDLWIHLDQSAIRDVAVLLVGARQVNFISASGSVTPLDLMHLSGHFGIPKMDGGVAVPVPGR